MLETIIFDMDGVIIDSEPIYFRIEKQLFDKLKIPVSYEEHCSYVGTSSQNMWQTILNRHGVNASVEEVVKKENQTYMDHLLKEKDLHPIPGVVQLIKELYENDFRMIVASSSNMEVIDIVLRKLDLSDYFLGKVSGTELTNSKPHPEIFIRAARLAKSEPGKCIVIEDSENGIISAKAAGMKCIGFVNPNSGSQDLSRADIIVQSFKQLSAGFIRAF